MHLLHDGAPCWKIVHGDVVGDDIVHGPYHALGCWDFVGERAGIREDRRPHALRGVALPAIAQSPRASWRFRPEGEEHQHVGESDANRRKQASKQASKFKI